jgi:hypothetical protein
MIFPIVKPAGKSELLSLVENLVVRFNKLVSVTFNFVANLVLRFNTLVSVVDAYKA